MTLCLEENGQDRDAAINPCDTISVSSEVLLLSERDYARLVEIINDPTPPTPALHHAMRKYCELRARYPERNL